MFPESFPLCSYPLPPSLPVPAVSHGSGGWGGGALLPPFTELPFLLFLKFEERFPVLRKCLSGLLTS